MIYPVTSQSLIVDRPAGAPNTQLTGASNRFWQSRQNTVKPKFDATAAMGRSCTQARRARRGARGEAQTRSGEAGPRCARIKAPHSVTRRVARSVRRLVAGCEAGCGIQNPQADALAAGSGTQPMRRSDGRKRILSLRLEDLLENRRLVRNHQLLSNLRFSICTV